MNTLAIPAVQPRVRIANHHIIRPTQHWTDRTLPDLQFILVCKGRFDFMEKGQEPIEVRQEQVLLIEPGKRHTLRAASPAQPGEIAGFHCELAPSGTWLSGDYRLEQTPDRVTGAADFAYLKQRFVRLAEVYSGYTRYRQAQTSAIAREIILILAEQWTRTANIDISARMQQMIQFIRDHIDTPLTRQSLASAFHITPEHVNYLFKKELGMTPSEVINRERVMLAYRLIQEEGCYVKEAAYRAGYTDPYYFSRVFKRYFGTAPSRIT